MDVVLPVLSPVEHDVYDKDIDLVANRTENSQKRDPNSKFLYFSIEINIIRRSNLPKSLSLTLHLNFFVWPVEHNPLTPTQNS